MAHFYGIVEGSARTQATRCGTKNSGMTSRAQSDNYGVVVYVTYNDTTNENVFRVYEYGGRAYGTSGAKLIHEYREVL